MNQRLITVKKMRLRPPHAQGMALIEALVACAVLGMGLAGATRLTLHTLQTASDTRQQTVGQMLGVDMMECHQSDRAACPLNQTLTIQGTTYTLQSQLSPRAGLALEDIEVRVQWPSVGRPPGTDAGSPSADERASSHNQLVFYSSRDLVPAWLGVSSP